MYALAYFFPIVNLECAIGIFPMRVAGLLLLPILSEFASGFVFRPKKHVFNIH